MPAITLNPTSVEKTIISIILDPLIPPVELEDGLVPAVEVVELDATPEGNALTLVKLLEHILLSKGLTHSAETPVSTTHSQRSAPVPLQLYEFGVGDTHNDTVLSQHTGASPVVCHVLV